MVTAPRTNLSVSQILLSSRVSNTSYTSTPDTSALACCVYRTSAIASARPATRPQARIALPVGALLLRLVAFTRRFLGMVASHLPLCFQSHSSRDVTVGGFWWESICAVCSFPAEERSEEHTSEL